MALETPLPGYGPDDSPHKVNHTQAAGLAAMLQEFGYRPRSANLSFEPRPIRVMVQDIEGAHRTEVSADFEPIPGPCILGGQLMVGNAISIWEKIE